MSIKEEGKSVTRDNNVNNPRRKERQKGGRRMQGRRINDIEIFII
jgi:hypothetical protein